VAAASWLIGRSCHKCPRKREAPEYCKTVQEWVEGYETECPVQWYNEFNDAFKAWNYAEKNILPNAGGWSEQPAILMHFVDIINQERLKANGN